MEVRSVDCKRNQNFLLVVTQSGYTRRVNDYDYGKEYYLPITVDDETLGKAVLDCLQACRWITYEDNPEFFYPLETIVPRYKKWLAETMVKYNYKTKTKMFRNMDSCRTEMKEGIIKITPMHHEKLERWGREKDDGIEDVIIDANSTPAEIGAALKLAFSRCTSY